MTNAVLACKAHRKPEEAKGVIDDPYSEFKREEMILRDWLALDRTVLANKRTFLAYGRTAIALIALGIAFVKLIQHRFFEVSGFALMVLGVAVFFLGLREFVNNSAASSVWWRRSVSWSRRWRRRRWSARRARTPSASAFMLASLVCGRYYALIRVGDVRLCRRSRRVRRCASC